MTNTNTRRGFTHGCFLKGFTLIELLVVVIIIAVLSAVALPMYKHAALKSRFSKVMPVAKSIVEAQEVYYLGKNIYAANDEKDLLDVAPSVDTTIELASRDQENQYNYVAASSTEVPGARYIMYQKHSPRFANTIQCEADVNNADALWLCEKGLKGQDMSGSIRGDGYKTFLLAGNIGTNDTFASDSNEQSGEGDDTNTTTNTPLVCDTGYCKKDGACVECDYYDGLDFSCAGRGVDCSEKTFGGLSRCNNYATCTESTFSDESGCQGTATCSYSTFADQAICTNSAKCQGATFTDESECTSTTYPGDCRATNSQNAPTFTDNAKCSKRAECSGAIFTGNSVCESTYSVADTYYGCGGNSESYYVSTFRENAVCAGTGCQYANYEGNNACCAGSSCPTGHVRKCVYNEDTGVYERVGYWDDQI